MRSMDHGGDKYLGIVGLDELEHAKIEKNTVNPKKKYCSLFWKACFVIRMNRAFSLYLNGT